MFCFALLSSHFQVKPTHSLHTTTDKLSRHAYTLPCPMRGGSYWRCVPCSTSCGCQAPRATPGTCSFKATSSATSFLCRLVLVVALLSMVPIGLYFLAKWSRNHPSRRGPPWCTRRMPAGCRPREGRCPSGTGTDLQGQQVVLGGGPRGATTGRFPPVHWHT